MYLEDAPTMHRSATQKTVALSSCKAELNAVCAGYDLPEEYAVIDWAEG